MDCNKVIVFLFRSLFQKSIDDREYSSSSPIVKDGASGTNRKKSDKTSSETEWVSIDIDEETISSAGDYYSDEWKRICTFTHVLLYACTLFIDGLVLIYDM